ncbi:hypothetical protein FB107DRAFT_216758 [Schizophyllum commune]
MGRAQKKNQTQKKSRLPGKIDYTLSEAHIGRNPGLTKAQNRMHILAAQSKLPAQESVQPPTSVARFSPQFPASFTNRVVPVANVASILRAFQRFRARGITAYGFTVQHSLTSCSGLHIPREVDARGLVSFVVNGEAIVNDLAREQLGLFITAADAPNMVSARVSLPGKPDLSMERALFAFLHNARGALTHLSLNLSFIDKDAFKEYLLDEGGARLVSLEIESSSKVQDYILEALMCPQSHCFPNLQRLCLRLKKLEVDLLVAALWQRHHWQGVQAPLHVETAAKVDAESRAEALALGVTFCVPDVFRHV